MGRKKPREEIQNEDVGDGKIRAAERATKRSQDLSGASAQGEGYRRTQTRVNVGEKARVRFWNAKKVDTDGENWTKSGPKSRLHLPFVGSLRD